MVDYGVTVGSAAVGLGVAVDAGAVGAAAGLEEEVGVAAGVGVAVGVSVAVGVGVAAGVWVAVGEGWAGAGVGPADGVVVERRCWSSPSPRCRPRGVPSSAVDCSLPPTPPPSGNHHRRHASPCRSNDGC